MPVAEPYNVNLTTKYAETDGIGGVFASVKVEPAGDRVLVTLWDAPYINSFADYVVEPDITAAKMLVELDTYYDGDPEPLLEFAQRIVRAIHVVTNETS